MSGRKYLILDACVLLNLLATGVIEKILKVVAQSLMVCVLVTEESLYLTNEVDVSEAVPIDLQELIENKVINICDLETDDERQMFVNLAIKLDDSEAASLAIALMRNWSLATDDKKARKVFKETASNEQLLTTTSDLIKEWAEKENIPAKPLKEILLKIELAARYFPSSSDTNFQWWNDILQSSE